MKSIKTKVLLIIFASMFSLSLLIGFISIKIIHDNITKSTQENIENICLNKKEELNSVLASIQQSVNIIANTSQSKITSLETIQDDSKYNDYISEMENQFTNISNNTNGAVAFYYRIDPELKDSTSGFFYTGSSYQFIKEPNTNLADFDENDIEHVGWFYIPKNNGQPTWVMPYKNLNVDIYMISYVVPIYFNDTFVGVIGMDIDFNVLIEKLDIDTKYKTALVYLAVENRIIYHEDYEYNSIKVINPYLYEIETKLINNMSLILSINKNEIVKEETILVIMIIIITILLLALFMIISYCFIHSIIKPLKDLTSATKKVLDGEFDININTNATDEVGVLAHSFKQTISVLHEKMDYINALAFKDSLTSVMSDTSYALEVERINQSINPDSNIHVLVFDINNLKEVNDNYGHEFGNKLIILASNIIAATFQYLHTYRIGGDEFIVIIENKSDDEINKLITNYNNLMENCYLELPTTTRKIETAYGYAKYNSSIDKCFEDMFNRADEEMYKRKRQLKEKIK